MEFSLHGRKPIAMFSDTVVMVIFIVNMTRFRITVETHLQGLTEDRMGGGCPCKSQGWQQNDLLRGKKEHSVHLDLARLDRTSGV